MDTFKTQIFIENSHYDSEERTLLLFVILTLTGDKRILVISADEWPLGNGKIVPLPDNYMYKWAETLRGKKITWELHSDPDINQASAETAQRIAEKIGVCVDDLDNALVSDKMDSPEVQKVRAQEEVRRHLRRKIKKGQI